MYGGVKHKRDINPGEHVNFVSKLTFFFVLPIFRRSSQKDFNDEDVYQPTLECGSKLLGDKLETEWALEKKKKNPSFLRAIYMMFRAEYLIWGILTILVDTIMMVAKPLLTGRIVAFFKHDNTISTELVTIYAVALIGVTFVNTIFIHAYAFVIKLLGLKIKIACSTLIYRKILKLNTMGITESMAGQAVTLITKDIIIFDQVLLRFHQLINAVVQIIVVMIMVYVQIGVSAFVGAALILALILIQAVIGQKTIRYRLATAQKTDERIQLTQEILSTIRVIKMYTLELFFSKSIDRLRRKEIRNFQILIYLRTFCMALGMLSTKLALYSCVVTFVALNSHITAEKAFVVAGCFSELLHILYVSVPMGFVKIAELIATLKRINNYLIQTEVTQHHKNSKKK